MTGGRDENPLHRAFAATDADADPALAQALAAGSEVDRLRRQAHDLVDAWLTLFSPRPATSDERVPLLRCAAPVEAGGQATAIVGIASEESAASEVTLYCTQFVGDSGYDIPSSRVSISPRTANIPAGGEAKFEVTIAVPQQTPPGTYSALFQAMGTKYVKAVVSVEVK